MNIEPVGVATFFVGILCLLFGPRFSLFALLASTLLGAASAASIGGANLPPAQILLGFVAVDLARRPNLFRQALRSVIPFGTGFWLLLTLVYGLIASIIMPRLFAGATYVFAIGQTDTGTSLIVQTPLGPGSGNVTQSLYFAADFLCFVVFAAFADRESRLNTLARAVVFCAFLDLSFAMLDLATYYTNTSDLLGFIRNASYAMLVGTELEGLKRIVGSFPEASTFAYVTIGLCAFTFNLWLADILSPWSGVAAVGCLGAIIFATSSTGYFGITAFLVVQYLICFVRLLTRSAPPRAVLFLVCTPVLIVIVTILISLHPATRDIVAQVIDATLFNKLDTDSGVERASWNSQAMTAFWATFGLGAGIGSVRASSSIVAVVASLGVFGTALYVLFASSIFIRKRKRDTGTGTGIREAARMGCLAQLITSAVMAGSVDLGLLFFSMASIASCSPLGLSRPLRDPACSGAVEPDSSGLRYPGQNPDRSSGRMFA